MNYRETINKIIKAVSLALSIAALVLLCMNFNNNRTIMVIMSIALVCNNIITINRRNK